MIEGEECYGTVLSRIGLAFFTTGEGEAFEIQGEREKEEPGVLIGEGAHRSRRSIRIFAVRGQKRGVP